jgi:small GTP-binding protein
MSAVLRRHSTVKLNIALGGESGVGKTSLFNTISKLELPGRKNYQVEAVEDDHVQASFVHEEYPIVFTLWDTAGLERYRSMTRSYFNDLTCLILVHITNPKCKLESLNDWIEKVPHNSNGQPVLLSIWSNCCSKISEEDQEEVLQKVPAFARLHEIDTNLCFTIASLANEDERVLSIRQAFNSTLDVVVERYLSNPVGSVFFDGSESVQLTGGGQTVEINGQRSTFISRSRSRNMSSDGNTTDSNEEATPPIEDTSKKRCSC